MGDQLTAAELHEKFKANLLFSTKAVMAFAAHLCLTNNDVYLPSVRYGKKAQDWKAFSDNGDLYSRITGTKEWFRYEVKYRRGWRTPPSYPYDKVYIERTVRTERMKVKPYAWALISADFSHAMIVLWSNHETWWKAPSPAPGLANHDPLEDMWWCNVDEVLTMPLLNGSDNT